MSAVTEKVTRTSDFTLQLALDGLSKDRLTTIRKQAAIKNASTLNREQLKQALIEKLPEAYATELDSILALMDVERISVLDEVVRRNGVLLDATKLNERQLQYWQELGLLFSTAIDNKSVIAMPYELVAIVESRLAALDRKLIQLNTTLLESIKGMLYFYGALSHEQAGLILQKYAMFNELKAPYMHVVINYRHYNDDFGLNEQYLYHAAIPDPTFIMKEQQQRNELIFAHFSAFELQQAGSVVGYIHKTQAYQVFVDFLMKQLRVQEQDALLIAAQAEFGIRAGLQLQDLVEYINREMVIPDEQTMNILLPRLIIMYNHTAQWFLKGHHASALSRSSETTTIDQAEQETVLPNKQLGRNDSCHCGSGKKYKKCCINKD